MLDPFHTKLDRGVYFEGILVRFIFRVCLPLWSSLLQVSRCKQLLEPILDPRGRGLPHSESPFWEILFPFLCKVAWKEGMF